MPITTDAINRITSTIIEAAIRVHRALGPGLLESALACPCHELVRAGLRIETQKPLPLVYEGVEGIKRVLNDFPTS